MECPSRFINEGFKTPALETRMFLCAAPIQRACQAFFPGVFLISRCFAPPGFPVAGVCSLSHLLFLQVFDDMIGRVVRFGGCPVSMALRDT